MDTYMVANRRHENSKVTVVKTKKRKHLTKAQRAVAGKNTVITQDKVVIKETVVIKTVKITKKKKRISKTITHRTLTSNKSIGGKSLGWTN